MTRLVIRPLADTDIQEIVDWYDEQEKGLGARFLDDLAATLARVRATPLQFPIMSRGGRRALMGRFPYAIYFLIRDERQAIVLAVLHQRRHPAFWLKRLRAEGRAG